MIVKIKNIAPSSGANDFTTQVFGAVVEEGSWTINYNNGPALLNYSFNPIETGVKNYTVDIYHDNQAVPADPATLSIKYTGSVTGAPVCTCSFGVYTSFTVAGGIHNLDTNLMALHSGSGGLGSLSGVPVERLSKYEIVGCAITNNAICTANRTETHENSELMSAVMRRNLDTGVHRGVHNTGGHVWTDVCIAPTEESRFVYGIEQIVEIENRVDDPFYDPAVDPSIPSIAIEDCDCGGTGSLDVNGNLRLEDPTDIQKSIVIEHEWTEL